MDETEAFRKLLGMGDDNIGEATGEGGEIVASGSSGVEVVGGSGGAGDGGADA